MPSHLLRSTVAALTVSLAACGPSEPISEASCLGEPAVDPASPVVHLGIHLDLNGAPLALGEEQIISTGAVLRPTKARFFVSGVSLLRGAQRITAELTDPLGVRAPYGVVLVDAERPDSHGLYLRAPEGDYDGMVVSVGVPLACPTGRTLNHADASTLQPPLDVDSDMYWSWDPGYVFLKFEGQVQDAARWEGFFFHVGEDHRLATLELRSPFRVTAAGDAGIVLNADFDRLLTTPEGTAAPDVRAADQRRVHGGAHADTLSRNIAASGFLRLVPHTH